MSLTKYLGIEEKIGSESNMQLKDLIRKKADLTKELRGIKRELISININIKNYKKGEL